MAKVFQIIPHPNKIRFCLVLLELIGKIFFEKKTVKKHFNKKIKLSTILLRTNSFQCFKMEDIQNFAQYSIFQLLQLPWGYYGHIINYRVWGKEVPFVYFHYVKCCTEICLKKQNNDLLDFYFVGDKIEQQVELFFLHFQVMKEILWSFCMG